MRGPSDQDQAGPMASARGSELLNQDTAGIHGRVMAEGLEWLTRRLRHTEQPCSGIHPEQLRRLLDGIDLDQPLSGIEAALDELDTLYLRDAVFFHHPRYVAHLNCPVLIVSLLGELISTTLNTAVETWDQSTGAGMIEQKVIDWTTARIGYGPDADGVFTSGGTQSNLMGLFLAREGRGLEEQRSIARHGLAHPARDYRILCSEVGHFSVQKAAGLLGLGHDAVVPVPCDRHQQMRPNALRALIQQLQQDQAQPLAVVATAGTTDFGSIDPIIPIARICQAHGLWLHVDAAYGGGLLLSAQHRPRLAGLEEADSVAIDYHKSFFQPLCCSAFLVREQQHLRHFTHRADYLNPREHENNGIPDLVNKSLQTSRRFDALKLWLSLRVVGADGIGEMLERVIALTRHLARYMEKDPDTELAHAPALTTLVFRFRAPELNEAGNDACNRDIRSQLTKSGEAVVANTVVGDRRYLKFTLLDPDTSLETLKEIHERILQLGHGRARAFMNLRGDLRHGS